tara:strand:- start:1834 stop:2151 length:318 start_codon:yes stop_codon:yes gene_type:complete
VPSYDFLNTETNEMEEHFMSYTKLDEFVENNPSLKQQIGTPMIVAGVGGIKTDEGWKETLSQIASAHPGSALDANYGNKSAVAVKERNAVDKWRKVQEKTQAQTD